MSLNKRRILYFTFLTAFFVITPTLIFYSLGYSFGSGLKLQKSGILVVKTEPEGATIELNGDKVQKFWSRILNSDNLVRTPAKVKNIRPGKYNVSVSLPGYWPWEKRLEILPGQTTFAEDIFLFKNDDPILISDLNEFNYFSANNKYLVSLSSSTALLYDIESEKNISNLADISLSNETHPKFSPNNRYLLTRDAVFDLNNWNDPYPTEDLFGSNYDLAEWTDNDRLIYYNRNKLFLFDLKERSSQEIALASDVISIYPKDNLIYLIKKSSSQSSLEILNTSNKKSETKLELPLSNYEFINKDHNLLNIYDTLHNILYIVDPNTNIKPLKEIIYGPEHMQWVTQNTLLYSSGYELWLFDLHNFEKKLLTRISDRINDIEWHPSNNYIVFSTNKSIYILELDSRDRYGITKIAQIENIARMIMDKKGEILYFISKQDIPRLYKMSIQ